MKAGGAWEEINISSLKLDGGIVTRILPAWHAKLKYRYSASFSSHLTSTHRCRHTTRMPKRASARTDTNLAYTDIISFIMKMVIC